MLIYFAYAWTFKIYATSLLDNTTTFLQIKDFANSIASKEIEILVCATLNTEINIPKLQKQLFRLGNFYLKEFYSKFGREVSIPKISDMVNDKLF